MTGAIRRKRPIISLYNFVRGFRRACERGGGGRGGLITGLKKVG